MVRSGVWAAVCLVAGSLAVSADASADTSSLARAGSWEAFGGTANNGRRVCGISAEQAGRYFGMKLFAGGTTFTIQMGTKEWTFESGRRIPLTMRFDANTTWKAAGTVFHFEDGDADLQFLQFDIARKEIELFANEFRNSSTLRVVFQENIMPPWLLGLDGTQAVDSAFRNCMKALR